MEEKTAEDYANIFRSMKLDHEINPIIGNIEDMLARLDEYETLLSNIKAETSGIHDNCINVLNDFSMEFPTLRTKIDKLESFVNVVNTNVNAMERAIDIAEQELNIPNYSLKNLLLKPLINKANKANEVDEQNTNKETNLRDGVYQEISIFKTDQYFKNQNQNDATIKDAMTKDTEAHTSKIQS